MFFKDNNRPKKYESLNITSDCLIRALNYATLLSYDEIAKKLGVYEQIQKKDTAIGYVSHQLTFGNVKKVFKDQIESSYVVRNFMTVKQFADSAKKESNMIIQCQAPNGYGHAVFMTAYGSYIDISDCGSYVVRQVICMK